MVNTTGGKQHKRAKKHRILPTQNTDNQVILAEDNQIYALVKKKIGGSRLVVECSDNKERSALIPGRFFKKLWFNVGDILLCSLEPNGDDSTCQIEHKYSVKDANTLKFQGKMSFDVATEQQENKGFKFSEVKKLNTNVTIIDSETESDSDSDDFGIMSNPNKQTKKSVSKSSKKQNVSCESDQDS